MPESKTEETKSDSEALGLPELLAMGVGGMIGGGIFSVLGMAVGISGHATPLAFLVGGAVALLAGYSYTRLAVAIHSDGASFTYLEHAFPQRPHVAGIAGWTIIVGYIGTLALYAFTFGAYASHLLGAADTILRPLLSVGALGFFMLVNLRGTATSGHTEDLIVGTKVLLLALFVVGGAPSVTGAHLLPVFDRGLTSPIVAGALVFVAFEGFQLITNAVCEMRDPEKNVPRGIYGSISITTLIYVGVSIVALGGLGSAGLIAAEEYALAEAARPALGEAGAILVDVAAMLATASAINATLFGASRLLAEMAKDGRVPPAFSHRSRVQVPWIAVIAITLAGGVFTAAGSLETIATFSSLVFLMVSLAVASANGKLRRRTKSSRFIIGASVLGMSGAVILLVSHLWTHERATVGILAALFGGIAVGEVLFTRFRGGRSPTAAGDVD